MKPHKVTTQIEHQVNICQTIILQLVSRMDSTPHDSHKLEVCYLICVVLLVCDAHGCVEVPSMI